MKLASKMQIHHEMGNNSAKDVSLSGTENNGASQSAPLSSDTNRPFEKKPKG